MHAQPSARRYIANIKHLLSTEATYLLVKSLLISRLDYCNSRFIIITKDLLSKLQSVQNTEARVVTRTAKYSHITPTLKQRRWLPLQARIEYKTISLIYQCYTATSPEYRSQLLDKYTLITSLRSENKRLLKITATRLK